MRLCILVADQLDPDLQAKYQGYGPMFTEFFRAIEPSVSCASFDVTVGEYPEQLDYDAYLITGSKADAFSDEHWVVNLRTFVKNLFDQGHTLLGICFGHQLIAHALGGQCGRSNRGWGIGRMDYEWADALDLFAGTYKDQKNTLSNQPFSLLASHRDQVVRLPAQANLLASNDFCPMAAYTIGTQVLCFQGHPEFSVEYERDLLAKRRELFSDAHYEAACASLVEPHDGQKIGRLMLDFVAASSQKNN